MISFCQPQAGEAELEAVREVFASNWLGAGERAAAFEREFGSYVGRPASELLTVSSCTEGLFQAVAALGIGPGDEVILPTVSFLGAAHAVRSTGAEVALCDVDPETLNPTVDHVARAITPATKAALILHFGGDPGDVVAIAELMRQRSLLLIEDTACALGSFVGGRACGTFGDVGVWSFDAMKLMTAGDGGMVWCRDPAVADRIRISIRMGVGSSGFDRRGSSSRWWEVEPEMLGRRATMNDIAAAIGLVQLGKVPSFLARRQRIASAYNVALAELPWVRVVQDIHPEAARYYYPIQVDPQLRDDLAVHLLDQGVYTNFRYWPLHRTRLYRSAGVFRGAERAASSTLLLPLHQALSEANTERVLSGVRTFSP